jgi:dihydroorotate dehydrogenase
MYKVLIKPIFFQFDPEKIHHFTFSTLNIVFKIPGVYALTRWIYGTSKAEKTQVFGLEFPNKVGLAAGFDKDAKLIRPLSAFGFGFIEIGTLTPKAQAGNDKPRLFRLPKDSGLINRMGFNNQGVDAAVERLKNTKTNIIIGGNIGKNKVTPNEQAVEDYKICFHRLFDVVDYFVVNVSSPNTPNLRELQEKEPLKALLNTLMLENTSKPNPKPILLKIAPDLSMHQVDDIIEIVQETNIQGLIVSNTTISRESLNTSTTELERIGMGGLSGEPVKNKSTALIKYIAEKSNQGIDMIAVGGIFTAEDAQEKLDAGAKLVQVYTGFVYEGPCIVKKILAGISKKST